MLRNDILLLAGVLGIALIAYFIIEFSKSDGAYAVVTVKGAQYGRYPLDKDDTIKLSIDEEHNTIVISDGYVWMEYSDCKNQICVKHKKIKYTGESIVCLPHDIVIEVIDSKDSDVDAVT